MNCPNFEDLLQNWQLRHELDRERKRREEAESNNRANLLGGFIIGAFLASIITLAIMGSGMEQETAEMFARLFASWAILFFAFVVLLLTINAITSRIVRWHNERKKQKTDSEKEGKNA